MKFQILILTFFLSLTIPKAWCAEDIVFIANKKNPLGQISHRELVDFFMKKDRTWPDGTAVRFFDHRDDHKNRESFLKTFIGKTSREIELYWIGEKIYTGHIAPIQITSDSMMLKMVARFPGGIGYVSKNFKLTNDVKKIKVVKN